MPEEKGGGPAVVDDGGGGCGGGGGGARALQVEPVTAEYSFTITSIFGPMYEVVNIGKKNN
jgi:hypothetical protein